MVNKYKLVTHLQQCSSVWMLKICDRACATCLTNAVSATATQQHLLWHVGNNLAKDGVQSDGLLGIATEE
jgi:alpha-D-ribose 1-methylphosphonate 5-triphosphate synthase subunit PhnH